MIKPPTKQRREIIGFNLGYNHFVGHIWVDENETVEIYSSGYGPHSTHNRMTVDLLALPEGSIGTEFGIQISVGITDWVHQGAFRKVEARTIQVALVQIGLNHLKRAIRQGISPCRLDDVVLFQDSWEEHVTLTSGKLRVNDAPDVAFADRQIVKRILIRLLADKGACDPSEWSVPLKWGQSLSY